MKCSYDFKCINSTKHAVEINALVNHVNLPHWMPQDVINNKSTLVQLMAWCYQPVWLKCNSRTGVMMPTLLSLLDMEAGIATTSSTINDDKVGIMMTLCFQFRLWKKWNTHIDRYLLIEKSQHSNLKERKVGISINLPYSVPYHAYYLMLGVQCITSITCQGWQFAWQTWQPGSHNRHRAQMVALDNLHAATHICSNTRKHWPLIGQKGVLISVFNDADSSPKCWLKPSC